MVDEDGGAAIALLGEFLFELRVEPWLGGRHLVNGDALPRLGWDKDFVRSLGLFAAPRNLCYSAKEAACALGWRDLGELLGDFAIDGKLLEPGER